MQRRVHRAAAVTSCVQLLCSARPGLLLEQLCMELCVCGTIIMLRRTVSSWVTQAASLLIAMPHAFCYVSLRKDLGSSGRKRRRQAAYVMPEDAALHAANVRILWQSVENSK